MKISQYFIILFLLIVSFLVGYFVHVPKEVERIEVKEVVRDTTIYITKTIPKVIVEDRVVRDTMVIRDTVWIKDIPTHYTFREEDYDLDVEATHLYDYQLDIHTSANIQYVDREITKTIKTKQHLNHGIQIGVGGMYDFTKKGFGCGVYVGYGLTYSF